MKHTCRTSAPQTYLSCPVLLRIPWKDFNIFLTVCQIKLTTVNFIWEKNFVFKSCSRLDAQKLCVKPAAVSLMHEAKPEISFSFSLLTRTIPIKKDFALHRRFCFHPVCSLKRIIFFKALHFLYPSPFKCFTWWYNLLVWTLFSQSVALNSIIHPPQDLFELNLFNCCT